MNSEELKVWQDDVMVNCHTLKTVASDRAILKELMIKHIRQFFDYDEIAWDKDMNEITLKFKWHTPPELNKEIFEEIGMPIVIDFGHEEHLGTGVWLKLYPFGIDDRED